MDPYSVEVNPQTGYTYDKEIRVMLLDKEIGVFDGSRVNLRFVQAVVWVLNWLLDGSLEVEAPECKVADEPVMVGERK